MIGSVLRALVPLPDKKSFEDAGYETFVVLHTSGSTEVPELAGGTAGTFATRDPYQIVPT